MSALRGEQLPVTARGPHDEVLDRQYALFRMTYRGDGGWSRALARGSLDELAANYLKRLGTEALFDLY
jgi:hypothetical protein